MTSKPSDPDYLSDQMHKVIVLADIYRRRDARKSGSSGRTNPESPRDSQESLQGADRKTDPVAPK